MVDTGPVESGNGIEDWAALVLDPAVVDDEVPIGMQPESASRPIPNRDSSLFMAAIVVRESFTVNNTNVTKEGQTFAFAEENNSEKRLDS